MDKFDQLFDVNSFRLEFSSKYKESLIDLYEKYEDELIEVCGEIKSKRAEIVSLGYSADFSDHEGELTYMLAREMKPNCIVEISPCNGYSTNYLLAALEKNETGVLHSYEITEQVNGKPIEDVIRGNLSNRWGGDRLTLHVGDVTQKEVPECDLLFMDSNHEMWFAAWFFNKLVPRAKKVFVHDIVTNSRNMEFLLPKAYSMGVREQYYVLQSLHMNSTPFFAACLASVVGSNLNSEIPSRHEIENSDRGIFFVGHEQTAAATRMHSAIGEIHSARMAALIGDRGSALDCVEKWKDCDLWFVKLQAQKLLGELGYRKRYYPQFFSESDYDLDNFSLPEFVSLTEVLISTGQFERAESVQGYIEQKLAEPLKFVSGLFCYESPGNLATQFKRRISNLIK